MGLLKGIVNEATKTIRETSADSKLEMDFNSRNITTKRLGDFSNNLGFEVYLPGLNEPCYIINSNGMTTIKFFNINTYPYFENITTALENVNTYNAQCSGMMVVYFTSGKNGIALNAIFNSATSEINNYYEDVMSVYNGFKNDNTLISMGLM